MTWYQNPFVQDFSGNWVLGDRQESPSFVCHRNYGRGDENVMSWNTTKTLSFAGNDSDGNSNDTLVIKYSWNYPGEFADWTTRTVTGTVTTLATATTVDEAVVALNSQTTFSDLFIATVVVDNARTKVPRVMIRQLNPVDRFRFFIVNGRAETVFKFNARASVAELPTYFERHEAGAAFKDSVNLLIHLVPGGFTVDADVIDNAQDINGISMGYDSSVVQSDWKLLQGKSGIFQFRRVIATVALDAITLPSIVVEFPAGAIVGDLSKRITYTYGGDATHFYIAHYTEEPHTLISSDLFDPVP